MKKNKHIFSVLPVCSMLVMACSDTGTKSTTEPEKNASISEAEMVKKGEHLVQIMGCNDCHSPKKMGPKGPEIIPELALSGFPSDRPVMQFKDPLIKSGFGIFYPDLTGAAGPWGISYAGNLTPDSTGLGAWTELQFKKALTEGKYKGLDGGRMLLPPMPWQNYTSLTDEEIKSIFAYLKQIKPVRNVVPQPVSPDKM